MPRLGVNIDHIATLRQIRCGKEPEPAFAALIAVAAGADSIVAHLREDRRHIREKDLYILKEVVKTKLNLEMSVAAEIVEIACKVKPEQATLVPEKRQEVTTEGGLDVCSNFKKVKETAEKLKRHGIEVSLFIDPEKNQIEAAKKAGVRIVELHTGRYADAKNEKEREGFFGELKRAAGYAKKEGLSVFAGHGLDYFNAGRICEIDEIEELNIGYSIVCRAALTGFDRAVREMISLIGK